MEIDKKAFASEICHSRNWNSLNRDPPWDVPKMPRMFNERLMHIQFTSCAQGRGLNISKALQSGVEKVNTAFLPVKIFDIRP